MPKKKKQPKNKPPAFQFFVKDWTASPTRQMMSLAAQGAYINLLAIAWDSDPIATIPNQPDKLWKLAGAMPEDWKGIKDEVLENFEPFDEDLTRLVNKRLRNSNSGCGLRRHSFSRMSVQSNKEERSMSETSTLIGYSGRTIGREELALVPTPAATETHRPVPHHEIVQALIETLGFRHIGVVHDEYAVSPDGMKAFGVLELATEMEGCRFSIGLRNSHDKSMRLAMTCGYRVFVCSNMAFAGGFTPVLAKTLEVVLAHRLHFGWC